MITIFLRIKITCNTSELPSTGVIKKLKKAVTKQFPRVKIESGQNPKNNKTWFNFTGEGSFEAKNKLEQLLENRSR